MNTLFIFGKPDKDDPEGMYRSTDAGKTWVSGTYVKESILRKAEGKTSEGNVIYQDTNNSTNDFTVSKDPVLRRNSKKASWAE